MGQDDADALDSSLIARADIMFTEKLPSRNLAAEDRSQALVLEKQALEKQLLRERAEIHNLCHMVKQFVLTVNAVLCPEKTQTPTGESALALQGHLDSVGARVRTLAGVTSASTAISTAAYFGDSQARQQLSEVSTKLHDAQKSLEAEREEHIVKILELKEEEQKLSELIDCNQGLVNSLNQTIE